MSDFFHDAARARALRKEEKEMMKANETLEEKRLRRLAKKEAKELKRKQKLGLAEYTNSDNPFGDNTLEQTFVWTKKYQKEGRDVDVKEVVRENKRHLEETRRELEQVKKRRLEREKEYEERQEEMARQQREKEMEHFKVFEAQEDTFHLKQAKLRSKIRFREGRAKAIDHLAQYYDTFTAPDPSDEASSQPKTEEEIADEERYLLSHIPEPYKILNGLRRIDLEDLVVDIGVYMELEKKRDLSFWRDMLVIVQDELVKLKNYSDRGSGQEQREGINSAVAPAVNKMFEGKSPSELSALQTQIEKKIDSGEPGIDVSYWEAILSKLKAHMAKARLRQMHDANMEVRYERLKIIKPKESSRDSDRHRHSDRHRDDRDRRDYDRRRDDRSDRRRERDDPRSSSSRHSDRHTAASSSRDSDRRKEETRVKTEEKSEETEANKSPRETVIGSETTDLPEDMETDDMAVEESTEAAPEISRLEKCIEDYRQACYSPELIPFDHTDLHSVQLLHPEEDEKQLSNMRSKLLLRDKQSFISLTPGESNFDKEARKGMSNDEVQFSVEEAIRQDKSVAVWAEKYKPRKPRYFNRVHTGFEWNKYNQTHYDVDNPPPKIVQGYKFNLFYPDLIDKSQSPKYTLTPCKDNKEFAIIRFSAGPPYEDIAFKIVNREWNFSYRSGFRSQFSNGILQLWFHFKRYRYRR